MTPADRFLDSHWRILTQTLMDDAGFGLREAIDFVPAAVDRLQTAFAARADQSLEEMVDVEELAARTGVPPERVRSGLGLVAVALVRNTPPSAARPDASSSRP